MTFALKSRLLSRIKTKEIRFLLLHIYLVLWRNFEGNLNFYPSSVVDSKADSLLRCVETWLTAHPLLVIVCKISVTNPRLRFPAFVAHILPEDLCEGCW